jgi:excinuclease ABC subunit A
MYVLDEPTTGLHFDDVRKLLEVLHRLADLGNTVIIIEHNLDVIHNADWIIDLGPEGGENGGQLVAQGRPAKVAATAESYTGQFLRRYYTGADGQLKELEEETATLLFDNLSLENDGQAVVMNSAGNGKDRTKRASAKDTKTSSARTKSSSATEKRSAASTNAGRKRVRKTGKA